jgi:streptogramin lyase
MNIDSSGTIWFSELAGGNLGRIDTESGSITEIRVPTTSAGSPTGMYDLQVAGNGEIWLASAGAKLVGALYATDAHIHVLPARDTRQYTVWTGLWRQR